MLKVKDGINNSDMVDGKHASSFALSNHEHSYETLHVLDLNVAEGITARGVDARHINVNGSSVYFYGHEPQYLRSQGNLNPETGRTSERGNLYTYNTAANNSGGPTTYSSVLGFGRGAAGTVEICGEWTGGQGLWVRSLRDTIDNWFPWQRVYTTAYKPSPADIGAATSDHNHGGQVLSCHRIEATTNADGMNYKVGDDCWIGDGNYSNGCRISGVSDWNAGWLYFGNGARAGHDGNSGHAALDIYYNGWGNKEIYTDMYITSANHILAHEYIQTYDKFWGNGLITSGHCQTFGVHSYTSGDYALHWEQATADNGSWFPTLRPGVSNFAQLGSSARRWRAVWCNQSSMNTSSDRRLKEEIAPMSEKVENLFMDLKPVQYRFKDDYDDNRLHNGFIAQEVEEAMEKNGIEYNDFSALLKFKPEMGEEPKFLNEDGEADYEYGLGYGEFTALNTHMIQKAFKEIEKLKEEIKLLKNNIV